MLLKELHESIDINKTYLHGGPASLEGGEFKRGGRKGHDMGALFFVPENEDGYRYALGYAIARSPTNWAIYRIKLLANEDEIFDFTNPNHKRLAYGKLKSEQFDSWEKSKGSSGHLDWTQVDEELLDEWGFKGAIFHERPKSALKTNKDIVSVGMFDAKDVKILEKLEKSDILERMPHLYNN